MVTWAWAWEILAVSSILNQALRVWVFFLFHWPDSKFSMECGHNKLHQSIKIDNQCVVGWQIWEVLASIAGRPRLPRRFRFHVVTDAVGLCLGVTLSPTQPCKHYAPQLHFIQDPSLNSRPTIPQSSFCIECWEMQGLCHSCMCVWTASSQVRS